MTIGNTKSRAVAVSGVATVDLIAIHKDEFQLSVTGATGTGAVTLQIKAAGTDEYKPLNDGSGDPISVLLSDAAATATFGVNFALDSVIATSDNSGDAFTLLVCA